MEDFLNRHLFLCCLLGAMAGLIFGVPLMLFGLTPVLTFIFLS